MTDDDWASGFIKSVAVFLNGQAIPTPDARGQRIVDDSFLVLFNAHSDDLTFAIPTRLAGPWRCVLDTSHEGLEEDCQNASGALDVAARALVVLQRTGPEK